MRENTEVSICAPTCVYTYVCNVCVQVLYLLTYRLHVVIHLQVVVFHDLVQWFSVARFTIHVNSPIV